MLFINFPCVCFYCQHYNTYNPIQTLGLKIIVKWHVDDVLGVWQREHRKGDHMTCDEICDEKSDQDYGASA